MRNIRKVTFPNHTILPNLTLLKLTVSHLPHPKVTNHTLPKDTVNKQPFPSHLRVTLLHSFLT
jgi:hypothetical protein